MKTWNLLVLALLFANLCLAQSTAIWIDEEFDDWNPDSPMITDVGDSDGNIDLLELQFTNDETYLFLRLKMNVEVDIFDQYEPHDIRIYIDGDANSETGDQIQDGFGADLEIYCDDQIAYFNGINGQQEVGYASFGFHCAPSLEATEFELALRRDATPVGSNELFSGNTVRVQIRDLLGGDMIPNGDEIFEYTFDDTPVEEFVPITLEKDEDDAVRIVAYNTLSGLTGGTQDNYERVIKALQPDIVGFCEAGNISASGLKQLMDQWIPLGTVDGWYTTGSGGLKSASKWPIVEEWSLPAQHPMLIDMPDEYGSDLLFTNAHLSCCASDNARQNQVDQFAAFILDAKQAGGEITLEDNTPFVYAGDLNLVGESEQLNTLLTGDIVNTGDYGPGGPLDWDFTDITDLFCYQTTNRMNYTWRRHNIGQWPPSRLDFQIYSDAVLNVDKSYTLQTELMEEADLLAHGLEAEDTEAASDHLPTVADYVFAGIPDDINDRLEDADFRVFPNPSTGVFFIERGDLGAAIIRVHDSLGQLVFEHTGAAQGVLTIDLATLPDGPYYLTVGKFKQRELILIQH